MNDRRAGRHLHPIATGFSSSTCLTACSFAWSFDGETLSFDDEGKGGYFGAFWTPPDEGRLAPHRAGSSATTRTTFRNTHHG